MFTNPSNVCQITGIEWKVDDLVFSTVFSTKHNVDIKRDIVERIKSCRLITAY